MERGGFVRDRGREAGWMRIQAAYSRSYRLAANWDLCFVPMHECALNDLVISCFFSEGLQHRCRFTGL